MLKTAGQTGDITGAFMTSLFNNAILFVSAIVIRFIPEISRFIYIKTNKNKDYIMITDADGELKLFEENYEFIKEFNQRVNNIRNNLR